MPFAQRNPKSAEPVPFGSSAYRLVVVMSVLLQKAPPREMTKSIGVHMDGPLDGYEQETVDVHSRTLPAMSNRPKGLLPLA
jgi:hypothetical protein